MLDLGRENDVVYSFILQQCVIWKIRINPEMLDLTEDGVADLVIGQTFFETESCGLRESSFQGVAVFLDFPKPTDQFLVLSLSRFWGERC